MAWRILVQWESGTALMSARDRHFASAGLDRRDRALVTELIQGTVRHLLALDHAVRSGLSRPEAELPGPVLQALRLGAYQLIHLQRIPDHAAVGETVQIIKESRYRRFAPLVNAVLRRIAEKGAPPVPSLEEDPARHLELATSTPSWLVRRLMERHGPVETCRILDALNQTPPITLRANPAVMAPDELLSALHREGIDASPGGLAPGAVIIDDRISPVEISAFREGLCTVQDEGAQLIAPLLDPQAGQRILDACAAPGGKAGHLAELADGEAFIVATDRSPARVRLMVRSLQRLRAAGVHCLAADVGTSSSPFADESFDAVLLDAPCSGTGVLRRHPEGKWRKDPGTIDRMAETQLDLLRSCARSLRPGGRLLYTTCSLLTRENEEVVDRFLQRGGAFLLDMRERYPHMRRDLFTDRGELRLWPHRHGCDGFYACLMQKDGG